MPTAKRPSVAEIDRDIVTCEVALVTLGSGGEVFEPERESLRRKLSNLLGLRDTERECGIILRFPSREISTPVSLPDGSMI